ncbi:hypothetical protein TNCV_5009811 [Trichonephila clavipes]|nr:hypothetical protein TNCV_5009811 [Trichonephila clavipes]
MKSNNTVYYDTGCTIRVAMYNVTVQKPHTSVSKLEYDHRDVAKGSGICQITQYRSIPLAIFAIHLTICGENACGFLSRVNEAMDALQTFYSPENDVLQI